MSGKKEAGEFNAAGALLTAHATNNRINTFLIRNLPDEVWRAAPPGGKGRDIASIVAHIHNVRLMWLKSAGTKSRMPDKLDGDEFTKADAIRALEESWQVLDSLLSESLAMDGRIKGFKPDVVSFAAYLVAHDAHHRGQISMLARQLGSPLTKSAMYGLWEWGTR